MKFKENLIEVMKSAVVHCGTQEKAEALLNELERCGAKNNFSDWSHWEKFGSETCYIIEGKEIFCDGLHNFLEGDYKIIEFEELLEDEQENDIISHPAHYCHSKYEPKDVIRDWGLNFNLGSAVKYIARAGHKDDIVQDLKKARQFLSFEIEALEEERNN